MKANRALSEASKQVMAERLSLHIDSVEAATADHARLVSEMGGDVDQVKLAYLAQLEAPQLAIIATHNQAITGIALQLIDLETRGFIVDDLVAMIAGDAG